MGEVGDYTKAFLNLAALPSPRGLWPNVGSMAGSAASIEALQMKQWSVIVATAMLAVTVSSPVLAAKPSEQQVEQLFKVMHLDQMFSRMNSQMAGVMHQAVPCVPQNYWQDFVDADATKELMNRMVPIYQNHFTADDVAGLLKFYRSPLGQKLIEQMPTTMAEGMKVGQNWGRERGQQMIQALQKKGTLDAQGQCPASPAAAASMAPAKH